MLRKKLFGCLLVSVMLGCLTACGKATKETATEPASSPSVTDSPALTDTNAEPTDSLEAASSITITHTRDLSNPNATKEAQLLYDYLCSLSGKAILSGQQESVGSASANDEINYLKRVTGKYPAIRGFDYINEDYEAVNKRAEFWANDMHGIVTICWHWGTPPDGSGYDSSKGKIDLEEALTEGTELNQALLAQMDVTAGYLKELQEAGVTVLWRPFHEFDGQWFWWGKGGSEAFIKLWQLMYDRYTNYHELNNLIWVLGHSTTPRKDWYPGDEYVDIAGADNYKTGTRNALYKVMTGFIPEGMPIPLHECGNIPNPDELIADGAAWTWFLAWHSENLKKENTKEELNYIYNHDYVITLDELPDFAKLLEEAE